MWSGMCRDARNAGAGACRTILAVLDANPGEPIVMAALPEPAQVAAIINKLRGIPSDQVLDLAIAKVRSMLPADVQLEPVAPLKLNIVPVPRRDQP
jgi:hypothetical protein